MLRGRENAVFMYDVRMLCYNCCNCCNQGLLLPWSRIHLGRQNIVFQLCSRASVCRVLRRQIVVFQLWSHTFI